MLLLIPCYSRLIDTERRTLSVASNDSGHGSGNELDAGKSPVRRRPFDKERFVSGLLDSLISMRFKMFDFFFSSIV